MSFSHLLSSNLMSCINSYFNLKELGICESSKKVSSIMREVPNLQPCLSFLTTMEDLVLEKSRG